MKVLQIIQKPQLRGAETFACQLSQELRKQDVEVDIAYLFPSEGLLKEKFRELKFISVEGRPASRFFDLHGYKQLHRIVTTGNYDLVQANAGDTLKYAVMSKKLHGWSAPLIFRNANKMSDFFRNSVHRKINRWLLTHCDYFISVSELCRRDLLSIYPAAKGRSSTITIGTNLLERSNPRAERNFPIFINIGALVPEKNHGFLLDIFALWMKKWSSGELWVIGDGKLREELQNKAISLNLQPNVKFLGYQSDPISLLRQADALVMPSLIEGLPGVILEALSSRIPVIASSVGGIPEVIQNGITGFAIGSFEPGLYVETMEKVVKSNTIRETIADNGYERIKRDFQLTTIADKFISAYKNLITSRK